MGKFYDDRLLFGEDEDFNLHLNSDEKTADKKTLQQVIEKTNIEIRKSFESQGQFKVSLKKSA